MSQVTMLRWPLQLEPDALGKNESLKAQISMQQPSGRPNYSKPKFGPESSVSRAMWNTPRSPMEGI